MSDPAHLTDREVAIQARLGWFYDLSLHIAAMFEIVYARVEQTDHDVRILLIEAALKGMSAEEPFVEGLPKAAEAINPAVQPMLLALARYAEAVQQATDPPEDGV